MSNANLAAATYQIQGRQPIRRAFTPASFTKDLNSLLNAMGKELKSLEMTYDHKDKLFTFRLDIAPRGFKMTKILAEDLVNYIGMPQQTYTVSLELLNTLDEDGVKLHQFRVGSYGELYYSEPY